LEQKSTDDGPWDREQGDNEGLLPGGGVDERPSGGAPTSKLFEGINRNGHRALGTAAFSLAAARLSFARSASRQLKAESLPEANTQALFPGFTAEMVETSETKIHVLRKGSRHLSGLPSCGPGSAWKNDP
jgi:hypothetical protein